MASNREGLAFLPYFKQLMELLQTNEEIKRTLFGVFSQVAWAASGASVGGLVAGPPGALVGGIAGSVIGYMRSDDYSSLMDVLRGLTDDEKENLVNEVQGLVGSTTVEDLTTFIGSQVQREALISCIREFVKACSGDASSDRRSSDTDRPPPYNPDWTDPRVPSAPPFPSEGHTDRHGATLYPEPPPPYSDRRLYPDLNMPSSEKGSI